MWLQPLSARDRAAAAAGTAAAALRAVSSAYLLETHPGAEQPPGLLIWLVVDLAFAERAAPLVTTAVQPLCSDLDVIIDVAVHDYRSPCRRAWMIPGSCLFSRESSQPERKASVP